MNPAFLQRIQTATSSQIPDYKYVEQELIDLSTSDKVIDSERKLYGEIEIHNFLTSDIVKNIYQNLLNVNFFTLTSAERIIIYKYLDINEPIEDSKLNEIITKLGSDVPILQQIMKFIKNFPKGCQHHEHNYSLGYTSSFIKYLLDNEELIKMKLVYLTEEIEEFADILINTIIPINSSIYNLFEEKYKGKFLLISPIIDDKNNETYARLINNDVLSVEIINTNLSDTIYYKNLEDALFITLNNQEIFTKKWEYLEYCANRWKILNTNKDIIPFYWSFIANRAIEENIQEIQIKYNFKLWSWNTDITDELLFNFDSLSGASVTPVAPTESALNIKKYDIDNHKSFNFISLLIESLERKYEIRIRIVLSYGRAYHIIDEEDYKAHINKIKDNFLKVYTLQEGKKQIVVGYDLIGEEDKTNRTILFYDMLKDFYNEHKDVSFMIHSGETNNTSYPANMNLITAYILNGSIRIGHGINLWKYPYLMQKIKDKPLLIELCPISNFVLGYINDIRNHPGISYLNFNIPVSISSDNRGLLNYNYVSYDWFEFFIGHKLPLLYLKNIAYNSCKFSKKENDIELINRWKNAYTKYMSSSIMSGGKRGRFYKKTRKSHKIMKRKTRKQG